LGRFGRNLKTCCSVSETLAQDEFSARTKNMLMQELDQSMAQQRKLVTMAQKLDSEVAVLEQTGPGPGSCPPVTTAAGDSTGLTTKSPRRRRRGTKRSQPSSDRVTTVSAPVVKDVVASAPDQQRPFVPSNLPARSAPLANPAGFMPPFSCAPPVGLRPGLVLAPMSGGAVMPGVRFVNGDDGPVRFPKHAAPTAAGVASLRLPRGRQDSSSSTDSAETVRHLEHGTCVGDVDRYLSTGWF